MTVLQKTYYSFDLTISYLLQIPKINYPQSSRVRRLNRPCLSPATPTPLPSWTTLIALGLLLLPLALQSLAGSLRAHESPPAASPWRSFGLPWTGPVTALPSPWTPLCSLLLARVQPMALIRGSFVPRLAPNLLLPCLQPRPIPTPPLSLPPGSSMTTLTRLAADYLSLMPTCSTSTPSLTRLHPSLCRPYGRPRILRC